MTQISLDLSAVTLSDPATSAFALEDASGAGSFTQHLARAQSDGRASKDSSASANDTSAPRDSSPTESRTAKPEVKAAPEPERQPEPKAEPTETAEVDDSLAAAEAADSSSSAEAETRTVDEDVTDDAFQEGEARGADFVSLATLASLLAPSPIVLAPPVEQAVTMAAAESDVTPPTETLGQLQAMSYDSSPAMGLPFASATGATTTVAPATPVASPLASGTAVTREETATAVSTTLATETTQAAPIQPVAPAASTTETVPVVQAMPVTPTAPPAEAPTAVPTAPAIDEQAVADANVQSPTRATPLATDAPATDTNELPAHGEEVLPPTDIEPPASSPPPVLETTQIGVAEASAAAAAPAPVTGQPVRPSEASAAEPTGRKSEGHFARTEEPRATDPAQAASPAAVGARVVAPVQTIERVEEQSADEDAVTVDATSSATPTTTDSSVQQAEMAASAATSASGNRLTGTEASGTTSTAATPHADANEQSRQADRARFAQRVSRAFEALGERGGSLRLKLSPPELGSLRLEISVQQGVMNARLEAETPAARNLLLESLPALRDRLAQQDIRVERFDVDLMDRRPGGGAEQFTGQSDSGRQSPERSTTRRTVSAAATGTTPSPTNAASGDSNHLNIVI
jgi:flagellar hook-length control protein FliK